VIPGIVHQDVHAAMCRDNLGHEGLHLPAIGNIDSKSGGAAACGPDLVDGGGYRALVLIGDDHEGSLAREALRNRVADARAGAGHNRHFFLQAHRLLLRYAAPG
jgi:hypothetical protein